MAGFYPRSGTTSLLSPRRIGFSALGNSPRKMTTSRARAVSSWAPSATAGPTQRARAWCRARGWSPCGDRIGRRARGAAAAV